MLKYGLPIAQSSNGLNYIFLQKNRASIFHLTNFEFVFVKEILVDKCMFEYAQKLKSSNNVDRREMGEKIQVMIDSNEWISTAKPVFKINDRMDVIM